MDAETKITLGLAELERAGKVIPIGNAFRFGISLEDTGINVYEVNEEWRTDADGPGDYLLAYEPADDKWAVFDFISPSEGNVYIDDDGRLEAAYDSAIDAFFALIKYLSSPKAGVVDERFATTQSSNGVK